MTKFAYLAVSLALLATFAYCAEEKVRQCSCMEMDGCWKEMHDEMKPCMDRCKAKLTSPGLDSAKAEKCFEQKKDSMKQCHEQFKHKMCAADDKTFLAKNETMQFHRHVAQKSVENSVEDDEAKQLAARDEESESRTRHGHHGGRRHRGHGFFHFIKANFPGAAKEFKACTKQCFKAKKNHGCARKLGCSIRRVPKAEWMAAKEQCAPKKAEMQQQLCACLKDAGMTKVVCEFKRNGGTNSKESGEAH